MAGTLLHGPGPASDLHPSAVDGTLYLRSDGAMEYRLGGAWVAVPLGGAVGPSLAEEFLSASGTTLPTPLAKVIVGTTPTGDYVDDAAGGHYALALDTTNEIESATLYQGDQLTFDVTTGLVLDVRIKVEPDVTGAGGLLAAGDVIVIGVASARNADPDLITTSAWFRLEGANLNILVETDDGTTDTDDQDTTVDWVADTWMDLRVDLRDLANVGFYVDGVLVQPVAMDMSLATGNLQFYVEVAKAAATNFDHLVTIDRLALTASSR